MNIKRFVVLPVLLACQLINPFNPKWSPFPGVLLEAQEMSLQERDDLLKSVYYYQMKLSPQVRRLDQVYRQLNSTLKDPYSSGKENSIARANSDKEVLYKTIRKLYEDFESFYNFKISLKGRYVPELEAAKNKVVDLVNNAIKLRQNIEGVVATHTGKSEKGATGSETQPTLKENSENLETLFGSEGDQKNEPPSQEAPDSNPMENKSGSEDLLSKMFSGKGEKNSKNESGAADYLDKKLKENSKDILQSREEELFAYEKKLFGQLNSEVEMNNINFNGEMDLRLQIQKETRRGDTLGRDWGSGKLNLLWNASDRWKVNFYDDLAGGYFLNHWVRNTLGSLSVYQHDADAKWTFHSRLINNWFTNNGDFDFHTWISSWQFDGDFRSHDEFMARLTTEWEWYPNVSFNDLWRLKGDLAYNTLFSGGGRIHVEAGGGLENLRNSDSFDNSKVYLNGDWFRQFDSGESWSVANYLNGRFYTRQNSSLYVSNYWEDNLILEYHHPLTEKTEFAAISDFFIRDYNVIDERDYFEYRGRVGINHYWRPDHSVDTGLSFIYHDDGFDGKSYYKGIWDNHYKNKVGEALLLDVTENFEVRTSRSGDLLDSYANDFILNFTWNFGETVYPGFRLGSLLKYYEDPVFSDYNKFLVGLNLKYKFGQLGSAFLGTDLYPTWYRNGNTPAGDQTKFVHETKLVVDTPLSNKWHLNFTARAENRFDTFYSTLSDELLEDYSTELDLASVMVALNTVF